jgi:dTMP kinase
VSRPQFISFEGTEGSGKSTQLERLKARLEARGVKVVVTREPGGTPLGEALRHLLKHAPEGRGMCDVSELLLFAASRAQLSRGVILPALESGAWVLSDRFADSTTVYQGAARRLPAADVEAVNRIATGGLVPGLTLVFSLSGEEALRRLRRRVRPAGQPDDRIESLPPDFFGRVRQGYLDLAAQDPARIQVIDADFPIDAVEAAMWKEVEKAFAL